MSLTTDSDEIFARRLQAQELGYSRLSTVDPQTPLMDRDVQQPTPPRIEVNTSWAATILIFFVNIPQVIAAIIVLGIHWNTDNTCDFAHVSQWKWWAAISSLRMFLLTTVVFYIQYNRPWIESRPEFHIKLINLRNTIDVFGLIWFVVGNMWLFGDDNNSCRHPEKSPIYDLCLSMLIINYIHICLPCIIAILLIPVFCFCMPCLIRMLARLQNPRAAVGAPQTVIDTIPLVTISAEQFTSDEDKTCPICLTEFSIGESARSLPCKHIFHQQCVDEWLRVNASCPTCRKRINETNENVVNVQMTPLNGSDTQV